MLSTARGSIVRIRVFVVVSALLLVSDERSALGNTDTWGDISDVAQYLPALYGLSLVAAEDDEAGGIQLGVTFLATAGTVSGLKSVIDKRRPEAAPGDREDAFPSGHTGRAWAGAAFVHRRYGCYRLEWDCWRRSAPAYGLATLTAFGRIAADEHDAVDVLGSAVVAETIAWLVVDRFDPNTIERPSGAHTGSRL